MTAISAPTALLAAAIAEARAGAEEGGIPVGSALFFGERLIASGRNQRVQQDDPILHGEMHCLQNAGRRTAEAYRSATLVTTLSPCDMCTGAILLFGIPRVIIGENRTFLGNEALLRERGVELIVLDDADCRELMAEFISREPRIWQEDIAS